MLTHQHLSDLSLRERPYSFRFNTSLMAAFSSARSAYIRFSFAFSASSSRRRFTSETVAPPYLLRHLKNVALLTPCLRVRSATETPLSESFKMPTIWLSLNFDFRMTAPDPEQSTFGCQSIGEAYATTGDVRPKEVYDQMARSTKWVLRDAGEPNFISANPEATKNQEGTIVNIDGHQVRFLAGVPEDKMTL